MATDSTPPPGPFEAGYARAIADLRHLADARAAYVHFDMDAVRHWDQLTSSDRTLMTQVQTTRQLASILDGTDDARGWLPSWRWDEWDERRGERAADG
jgi:hypothetical protein